MNPYCDRPPHDLEPDEAQEAQAARAQNETRPRERQLPRSWVARLERLEGEVTVSLVLCGFCFGLITGYQLAFFLPLTPWWWFF